MNKHSLTVYKAAEQEVIKLLEQLGDPAMLGMPPAPGAPPGMPPDALGGLTEPVPGMDGEPEEKDPNKALLGRLKKKDEADIRKTLLSKLQGEDEESTLEFFSWVLDADEKQDAGISTGTDEEEEVKIPPKVVSVIRDLIDQFEIDEDSLPEPEEPEEEQEQPAQAPPAPPTPPAPGTPPQPQAPPVVQESRRLVKKQEGNPAMSKNKKVNISEEKLQRLVSLVVEKKLLQLREGKKFQAVRSLAIQAQQAAMKFEETMVNTLELVDPDDLTEEEQRVYAQAMADMHSKIIEAVVEASEVLKNLSSKPDEEDSPKKDKGKAAQQPAVAPQVSKDLPTLQLPSV